MTEYHKFSQLKDKFPTLDSNNVDYTTAVASLLKAFHQ